MRAFITMAMFSMFALGLVHTSQAVAVAQMQAPQYVMVAAR